MTGQPEIPFNPAAELTQAAADGALVLAAMLGEPGSGLLLSTPAARTAAMRAALARIRRALGSGIGAELPELVASLVLMVGACNTNYTREAMETEGIVDRARRALVACGVDVGRWGSVGQ